MIIDQKPWLCLKTRIEDAKILNDYAREGLLKSHKIIGLKVYSEEKMYSQLLRRFIEILIFTKFSCEVKSLIKKIEENASPPYLEYIPDGYCDFKEKLVDLLNRTENLGQLLELLYNSVNFTYFETLSRQLIINELASGSDSYNYRDDLLSWVHNINCDIEGELFNVLANALCCQIIEYSKIFEIKKLCYGKQENSDLFISYLRVSYKNYFLMTIEQMENSGFEFNENKYNLE